MVEDFVEVIVVVVLGILVEPVAAVVVDIGSVVEVQVLEQVEVEH